MKMPQCPLLFMSQHVSVLFGPIVKDLCAERGPPPHLSGVWGIEAIIAYWRRNRIKYPRPLTRGEGNAKRRKKEEEREMEKWRLREERACQGFVVDPNAKYAPGSWKEYFQKLEANRRRAQEEEMEERAIEVQMEAMKALLANLPIEVPDRKRKGVAMDDVGGQGCNVEKKGKGVAFDDGGGQGCYEDDNDWGEYSCFIRVIRSRWFKSVRVGLLVS
ncbi:hypothetical protein BAE44_0017954 [Dichanthelium oligosanthes]|uniref:Uncharacterized protein n=1 Tax=Dichanthelium oligosanthes TaxID=888268 RepID=A0A1E5V7J9_9POAL|nr:hypothetical protein BAE44_0017954 [Dichanthelium oligosanthes]